ncbi:MAG TPA: DoxX family membrane protein [Thermomicrobiaceae bacterium]|nr:DoxX family membrane protein [Thermomicrobiaceae bacterium]
MGVYGYLLIVVLAAVLAAAGQYALVGGKAEAIDRQSLRGWGYLFLLGLLGVFGGSRWFGGIGSISSLSKQGPTVDGFYILTGLVGGLVLIGVGTYALYRSGQGEPRTVAEAGIHDPQIAHLLFGDTRSAPLWLAVRLFVGYEWLSAGYEKITSSAWMDGGTALKGYWTGATAIPTKGNPSITYGWYRDFLSFMLRHEWYSWFGPLIAVGEFLVGIALIVGLFVGIAAFFGSVMNFSYMLAGSASTNPVLFGLTVFIILAWKVAGYLGLDRYALPILGAPWSPGRLVNHAGEPGTRGKATA